MANNIGSLFGVNVVKFGLDPTDNVRESVVYFPGHIVKGLDFLLYLYESMIEFVLSAQVVLGKVF